MGCDVFRHDFTCFVEEVLQNEKGEWLLISDYGHAFKLDFTWLPTIITRYAYGLDEA